jgi:hypothetical protein
MKPSVSRVLPALLLLALFPASLSAISVFDVIRLTQERYPDREIIRIIQVTDSRFVLNAEDASRLKKEGVTETVIREMLSRPARENAGVRPSQPAAKPSRSSTAARDSGKNATTDSRKNVSPEAYGQSGQSREPAAVLDEIVRLTKAGLSDETVLAYAKAHRAELPAVLPNDRLTFLRDSGVSRTVILYLTAIDVRASNEGAAETAVYESEETESPAAPAYSSPEEGEAGTYDAGYYDGESYPVSPDYYYPPTDYLSYYGGYYGYPYYGDFYYPWPAYFFVDVSGFFGRFHHGHGHGHDHDGHRRGDGHGGDRRHGSGRGDSPGDHRGGGGGRGGHGGNVIAGQSWRDRPTMARGDFTQTSRQPREFVGRGGQGRSTMPSRGLDRATRGGFGGPRVVGRPGFSSGNPGTAMSRAPVGRSGGPGVVGRPGFSGGGGSVGRAPTARSGGSFGGGGGRSGGFSGGGHGGGGGRGGGGRGR